MFYLENSFYLRQKVKMPLWVRFLFSLSGAALTVVTALYLVEFETLTVIDQLRTFFGFWLGPVSIFGAIVGYWVQPSSLHSTSE